jgi:NAD(P)-dependent dehydrogenase (short-subunit alcohol dehydrogenase family)
MPQCSRFEVGRPAMPALLGSEAKVRGTCVGADRPRFLTRMQATQVATESAKARNADENAVAVIVGGSRGIGLAMVKDLMTRFQGHVFATGRSPHESAGLLELMQTFPGRISPVALDVTNEDSVIAAAETIRKSSHGRADLVVNTAGILHDISEPSSEGRMPERQLKDISEEWLLYNFKVNTMGPVWVAKHLQDLLETKGPRANKLANRPPAVLATLSARVGSIEDNRLGGEHWSLVGTRDTRLCAIRNCSPLSALTPLPSSARPTALTCAAFAPTGWYSYRISKAAQNQFTRTVALGQAPPASCRRPPSPTAAASVQMPSTNLWRS